MGYEYPEWEKYTYEILKPNIMKLIYLLPCNKSVTFTYKN